MIYVIGSGPAGVAAAYALVKKGKKVVMLDAGIGLEQEKESVLKKLQQSKHWKPALLEKIKGNKNVTIKGVAKKLIYGSDYPYKEVNNHLPLEPDGVEANPSFAAGGLSSVWGAAVVPYRADDMADWPVSLEGLAPYYTSVLDFMDMGVGAEGKDDGLQPLFPLYTRKAQHFRHSNQAGSLLRDLQENKEKLHTAGIYFGSSRLAVQFAANKEKPGCVYCGLCLHGCPYKLIYNSAFTIAELKKHKNFHYKKDIIVEKLAENKDGVTISGHHRVSRKKIVFKGSQVFLACGALTTTRIMLASMGAYEQEITLKDSQYYIFHLLRYHGAGDVAQEWLHSLAQVYLEIFDKKIDEHSIHLQLYTYSDLYENVLQSMFGFSYRLLKRPLNMLKSRIIIGQGYLHSDSSQTVSVMLRKGKPDILVLRKQPNKGTE